MSAPAADQGSSTPGSNPSTPKGSTKEDQGSPTSSPLTPRKEILHGSAGSVKEGEEPTSSSASTPTTPAASSTSSDPNSLTAGSSAPQQRTPSGKPRPMSSLVSQSSLSPGSGFLSVEGESGASPAAKGKTKKRTASVSVMATKEKSKEKLTKERKDTLTFNQRLGMAARHSITTFQLSPEAAKVIQPLTVPTYLTKISAKNGRPLQRKFYIDLEKLQVSWMSKSKASEVSCVRIRDIVELRVGYRTDRLQKRKEYVDEELCFSIVHGGTFDSLDLICNSPEEREAWVTGIRFLIEKTGGDNMFSFLKQMMARVDVKGENKVNFEQVWTLLKAMNIHTDKKRAKRDFDAVDVDKNGTLDFEEFTQFYWALRYRKEVHDLYRSLTSTQTDALKVDDLKTFLETTQDEVFETDEEFLDAVGPFLNDRGEVPLEGFARYLESSRNSAIKTACQKVYQDMTKPLSHYYIFSSHNTYLLGDQLRGKSSTEAYIRAFKQGCRCVELDCWDGPNNDPIIFHGHTLTSKILFRDVIATIKEYAFQVSDYPVILSLENHCSVAQQEVMATIMEQVLGDLLLKEPINGNAGVNQLPSPEELKRKIILKGKGLLHTPSISTSTSKVLTFEDFLDEEESDDEIQEMASETNPKDHKEVNEHLASMVVYCKTASFKSFQPDKNAYASNEICSFSEKSSEKHCTKNGKDFIQMNKKRLSRIFPAGSRVDSSNYSPLIHWIYGCHLVALNFQTMDINMELNLGKFQDNGKCGYVLKPSYLRDDTAVAPRPRNLKITFLSAQQLPKPANSAKGDIIDPYIVLEVFGADQSCMKVKTTTVRDNGFNPLWDESFEFSVLDPELTLMRFSVMDEDLKDDAFVASNVFPLNMLAFGYRPVPLYDAKHNLIPFSCIFIKVEASEAKTN